MATDTKFASIPETNNIGDLTSKSIPELKELLERQNHLLTNKSLISKLKDNGAKIERVYNEIVQELESRNRNVAASSNEILNSTACEWVSSENKTITEMYSEDTDPLKILSDNGRVHKYVVPNKTHIKRLIDKEKDSNFSFKPYSSTVAKIIKQVVPHAHTNIASDEHSVKTIHLGESLNLLTEQLSALKVLYNASCSKRANDCIQDILHENNDVEQQENPEIIDEFETKPDASVNINLNN